MKVFVEPSIEVVEFAIEDIITASGNEGGGMTFMGSTCVS